MTFREGLLRARGQIMFLLGLLIGSALLLGLESRRCVPVSEMRPVAAAIAPPPAEAAEAWRYFERNQDRASGLVHASEGSGWTTAADTGHLLRALLAAHRLGLVDGRDTYDRVDATLRTLAATSPSQAGGRLDTRTGRPVPGTAPDATPLLTALEILAWSYPANAPAAREQLERWRGIPAPPVAPGSPSEAARHADRLVQAALARGFEAR